MDIRALIIALLALFVATPSYAVFIDGELTTLDALGTDANQGDFYYDLYYVAVDTPMTIEVFMNAQDAFAPYMAYWAGDFSPTPDWYTPPPLGEDGDGSVANLYMSFDAMPGINYQIMASTYNYNPTDLGNYDMYIVDPDRTNTGFAVDRSPMLNVPEPATGLLLGLGLIGIGAARRDRVKTRLP
ncbi:MAG: PEP-CTERM sorting domain-containing protein [Gammaproteobacteria bacterium]|jgi:hypothetical protein